MNNSLILVLCIVAAAFAAVPAASATDSTSCTFSGDYGSCTFTCYRGDTLAVHAQTTGPSPGTEYPRTHVSCGGVDFFCQSQGSCTGTSGSSAAQYEDHNGRCYSETVYNDGGCASSPGADSDVFRNSEGTGSAPLVLSTGPVSIDTPAEGQVCAPSNVVCAGPVQSIHVATIPGIGPISLLPATDTAVSYDAGDQPHPGTTSQTVGPIQVLGQPVPVVVCATPCTVPSGATLGAPDDFVQVTETVGGTSVPVIVTLP